MLADNTCSNLFGISVAQELECSKIREIMMFKVKWWIDRFLGTMYTQIQSKEFENYKKSVQFEKFR